MQIDNHYFIDYKTGDDVTINTFSIGLVCILVIFCSKGGNVTGVNNSIGDELNKKHTQSLYIV